MRNEDRFWLGREDTSLVLATSAGFTDSVTGQYLESDRELAKKKMLRDWNIGTEGHSGYGKWQIDMKSATEFEVVASHALNVKSLELPLS